MGRRDELQWGATPPPSPREVQEASDILGDYATSRVCPKGIGSASPDQHRELVRRARQMQAEEGLLRGAYQSEEFRR